MEKNKEDVSVLIAKHRMLGDDISIWKDKMLMRFATQSKEIVVPSFIESIDRKAFVSKKSPNLEKITLTNDSQCTCDLQIPYLVTLAIGKGVKHIPPLHHEREFTLELDKDTKHIILNCNIKNVKRLCIINSETIHEIKYEGIINSEISELVLSKGINLSKRQYIQYIDVI